MKIGVLIPSEEYRQYAGARIRYGRLQPCLAELGIDLELVSIADFSPAKSQHDALIFSKCYDGRSLILANVLGKEGRLVGVDLFDDYFSQLANSRLLRFRNWLRQIVPACNFALCSTPAMAKVVRANQSDLPCHILNDPAPQFDPSELADRLTDKLLSARRKRKLQLAWFGVGDNPYFNVGLRDLAAHSAMLGSLSRTGLDVELRVLTNARALTSGGLSYLKHVPVRTKIEEWSEDRERVALEEAFASFLPVDFQTFSAAKSLNRAVSALSFGCQVIAVGYPLYRALDPLIYDSVDSFVDDFNDGTMRFSPSSSKEALGLLGSLASADREAQSIVAFLKSAVVRNLESPSLLVLVHGRETSVAAHQLVQEFQGLSVASPFCTSKLQFDVIFKKEMGRLVMLVSERAIARLGSGCGDRIGQPTIILNQKFWRLPNDGQTVSSAIWSASSISEQVASYYDVMNRIRSSIEGIFGQCRLVFSETSSLPFSIKT